MKKNFICNFILSGLLLLSPLSMFAQRVDSNLPWSVRMVESEMIRCPESWQLDFQPKLKWDYCHGLELQSMLDVYDRYGNRKIYDYALAYADTMVNADGTIKMYKREEYSLDRINSGKFIFRIYEQTKDEKYKKALALMRSQLDEHPRNADGGFWHKKIYPNQVWLDGLYMGQPFYMEYETRFNDKKNYPDIFNQFFNVVKNMRDEKTGLYYHAYDSSKEMFWCDKTTGLSKNFWLRALGWYSMALLDTLTKADNSYQPAYDQLKQVFIDLMESMVKFQDESGMWYQVVNMGGREKNYLETSGSAIMAYSMLKGVRLGFLPESFRAYGEKAFHGICDRYLKEKDGRLSLGGICLVAGLGGPQMRDGTYEYYMSEPVVEDDAKGVGPFLLAYTEIRRLGE